MIIHTVSISSQSEAEKQILFKWSLVYWHTMSRPGSEIWGYRKSQTGFLVGRGSRKPVLQFFFTTNSPPFYPTQGAVLVPKVLAGWGIIPSYRLLDQSPPPRAHSKYWNGTEASVSPTTQGSNIILLDLFIKGDWRVEERTTLNKRMNCC